MLGDLRRRIEDPGILHIGNKNGEESEDDEEDQLFLRTCPQYGRNDSGHDSPKSPRNATVSREPQSQNRTAEARVAAILT